MKRGDSVEVVDGKGHVFGCEILEAHPKHTSLEIVKKVDEPLHWSPNITLALAPTKNIDRMEWLVEKAVEIGVNRLVFLDCAHNVRRVVKRERIERIIVSAMKQSLKAWLPDFVEMIGIGEFLESDTSLCKYIGFCNCEIERKELACEYDGVSDVTIMIGPEGDFTSEEVELAVSQGFIPVTFGDTRLRTETAALYALCSAHTIITQKQF